ncbi:MAG: hypothetical protein ACR2PT_11180 [Endozoicomonas sp.]
MDLSLSLKRLKSHKFFRSCYHCTLVFLTIMLTSTPVRAEMTLDRLIVDFDTPSRHHEDIQVFNQGENNLYVNVSLEEVINPGTDREERAMVKDVLKRSLVVSPSQLIVPANSRKNVRILTLEEATEKDRIFRIGFTPALGKLKAKTSGIKLLLAYQALVILRPEKPVASVDAERKGEFIVFRNKGNTNVLLQNGKQCDPQAPKQCQELQTRRLYAGNEWQLKTPFSGPVTYDLDDGNKVQSRTFGERKKSEQISLNRQ